MDRVTLDASNDDVICAEYYTRKKREICQDPRKGRVSKLEKGPLKNQQKTLRNICQGGD